LNLVGRCFAFHSQCLIVVVGHDSAGFRGCCRQVGGRMSRRLF
jgi:hypothetical protein